MPKLIIDDREITVPAGTSVIQAAERLGIMIPRFCYHEALGAVGACRLCAVKFLAGPVKGVDMSCMVEAADGMVVSTTDEEAALHRKQIIEWLMMNHPHDCPVCDEGGHCLLQDETVSGGHVLRAYPGLKRTYQDQELGVFVQHEMNRCIHCWRCRRFYQEYAGYRDLGVMQIAARTYFGRFEDGPLVSPFAGNLIDLCPTGVFTDKPARFKGRRWDFERGPSLCLHCSLGCNATGSVLYREVVRQEARLNRAVNGHFICDRGRFGFPFHQHPDRPRRPRSGGKEISWSEAFQEAGERFTRALAQAGPQAARALGSARLGLETQAALTRFCQDLGWPAPRFFLDPSQEKKVQAVAARLDRRLAVSLAEIEAADFVLILGADPVNEAPMAALAVRQAWRQGATVVVADPRPVELPLDFEFFPAGPDELAGFLSDLIQKTLPADTRAALTPTAQGFYDRLTPGDAVDRPWAARLEAVAARLRESRRPMIVCGTDVVGETLPDQAADHALLLQAAGWQAGLFYLLPGPNAFGAGLLTEAGGKHEDLVEAMEQGEVKALLLVESDPFFSFPSRKRLEQALSRVEFVAVMDYLPSRSFSRADVAWPTQTVFESRRAAFVNQEGRLQVASPLCQGGLPLSQISGQDHPPRTFQGDVPGADVRPAWEILSQLALAVSGRRVDYSPATLAAWLQEQNLVPTDLPDWDREPDGGRILWDVRSERDFASMNPPGPGSKKGREDELKLLLVDWTFGTEELSSYSPLIQAAEAEPVLVLGREDAEGLDLSSGDRAALEFPEAAMVLTVRVEPAPVPGALILPRHRRLEWQQLPGWSVSISRDRLKKV
jgi:NADH-quinone oxidoreductase subunit G